jgi:hypothetical protein
MKLSLPFIAQGIKINHFARISKKISFFNVVLLFLTYVVFSLLVGGPGILHTEMDVRLPARPSFKSFSMQQA